MKNAEKFRKIFKEFATEVWAFPEKDFLTWLNAEYEEPTTKNDLGVEEVTALAEWTEKLTKASEDAYNKGFADGANEVLDKLRAEIETKYGQCDICEYFEDYDYEENDISEYRPRGNIADVLQIIDKYRAEEEKV